MSDPLDQLLSGPETPEDPALSPAHLKSFLSAKLYEELTDGDDAIATRCIEGAILRAEGLFYVAKTKLNLATPLHRQIVINLAVYELFAYVGDSRGGKPYSQTATDLVATHFGSAESVHSAPPALGSLRTPQRQRL